MDSLMDKFNDLLKWQQEHQERLSKMDHFHEEKDAFVETNLNQTPGRKEVKFSENIQKSIEKSFDIENSPLKPGIDGKRIKSFEELLEKKINRGNQDESGETKKMQNIVKRPFLRKGKGLEKYQKVSKPCLEKGKKLEKTIPLLKRKVQKVSTKKPFEIVPSFSTKNIVKKINSEVLKHWSDDDDENDEDDFEEVENLKKVLDLIKNKKEELKKEKETKKQIKPAKVIKENYDGDDQTNKISPFTLHLRKEIENLEKRLVAVQISCDQREKLIAVQKEKSISEKISEQLSLLDEKFCLLEKKVNTLEKIEPPSNINKLTKNKIINKNTNSCVLKHTNVEKMSVNCEDNKTMVKYENGDQMIVTHDNTIIYRYAADGTKQTTYPDGLRLIEFQNGQTERIHTNGSKHIFYPSKLQRIIHPDGSEEVISTDGTIIRILNDGNEIVELPNGEREIRTNEYKRREYKDGTVKIVYVDGTQETRYTNGRLKIKDSSGKLVVDSLMKTLEDLE